MASYLDHFNYQISGPTDGRRWVFLHGLMGSLVNWKRIVSELSATERILTYDQRGHGKSFQPDSSYAPEDYAEDLHLITEELGWSQFILVGHSMGARNSLLFAFHHPQKVSKLIMEDLGPEARPNALAHMQLMMNSIPTPFESLRAAKEFFLNKFPVIWKNKNQEPAELLGQFLYSNLIENDLGQAVFRFSKQAILESVRQGREKNHWHELQSLKVPSLIIRGQNSKELSHEIYSKMLQENPNLLGVEIADAGHWVHYDRPQDFIQAIKSFVGGF